MNLLIIDPDDSIREMLFGKLLRLKALNIILQVARFSSLIRTIPMIDIDIVLINAYIGDPELNKSLYSCVKELKKYNPNVHVLAYTEDSSAPSPGTPTGDCIDHVVPISNLTRTIEELAGRAALQAAGV